ncbi:MAG: methyltransferase domain-containing protein [Candidatus Lokiarchaeota archaeon]|nr:methyltransferase domain-containing protein [Candidatus Lokiarchaeota archaeon]MBD3202361.1 methyltransferase domain-containing protein [Candidatus Lokiarchaeota archaeon]
MSNIKKKLEKPQYGWYVKNLVFGFTFVGLIGIALIIISLYRIGVWQVILFLGGIILIIIFLWPGIGLAMMNIILDSKDEDITESFTAINENQNSKILDIGCGTGRTSLKVAKMLKNGGYLYGIDIYSKMAISGNDLETVQHNAELEGVAEKTSFKFGSATEIPFDDESFDIVNVSSVLHEIHEKGGQMKALNEIYRVLKPGGTAYIGEWNRYSFPLILYSGVFCIVFKPKQYWKKILEKSKLKLKEMENQGGYILFTVQKYKVSPVL